MIFFITNRKLAKNKSNLEYIKEASYAGVDYIILREKDLSDIELEKLYYEIKDNINPKCKIIINSNINVFNKVNEEIIHLPYKKFLEYENLKKRKVGVSVHTLEEGIYADKAGADYILASHIFETKCKEGLEAKGTDFIKKLRENVKCKIVALGGINEKNKKEVLEAGADGVAMMSFFYSD